MQPLAQQPHHRSSHPYTRRVGKRHDPPHPLPNPTRPPQRTGIHQHHGRQTTLWTNPRHLRHHYRPKRLRGIHLKVWIHTSRLPQTPHTRTRRTHSRHLFRQTNHRTNRSGRQERFGSLFCLLLIPRAASTRMSTGRLAHFLRQLRQPARPQLHPPRRAKPAHTNQTPTRHQTRKRMPSGRRPK